MEESREFEFTVRVRITIADPEAAAQTGLTLDDIRVKRAARYGLREALLWMENEGFPRPNVETECVSIEVVDVL